MAEFVQVNEKVVSTRITSEAVYAVQGSMLCFTGNVQFQRSFLGNGGIQNAAMRAVTGEGISLMSATGSGEIWYGHHGRFIKPVQVGGQTLCVESSNVLAFDSRLRAGTMFLGNRGVSGMATGMMAGQGLFTSTFEGHGEVAILSDGDLIGLDVRPDRPLFVDPQAYIGHLGQLQPTIHTDLSWKNLIGQGSGEAFQLKFTGTGTVYIQASEV